MLPPIKSGNYVRRGDFIFTVDVGPANLEVESTNDSKFGAPSLTPGSIVRPDEIVGTIDLLAEAKSPTLLTRSNILSFFLGVIVASAILLSTRHLMYRLGTSQG